ncbi:hypothetical protein HY468_00620 [Candidatus Roizmanbacteria bacterium]|nr:hypothetical protein [Candidatus Roizmanbacteria bacterium]
MTTPDRYPGMISEKTTPLWVSAQDALQGNPVFKNALAESYFNHADGTVGFPTDSNTRYEIRFIEPQKTGYAVFAVTRITPHQQDNKNGEMREEFIMTRQSNSDNPNCTPFFDRSFVCNGITTIHERYSQPSEFPQAVEFGKNLIDQLLIDVEQEY